MDKIGTFANFFFINFVNPILFQLTLSKKIKDDVDVELEEVIRKELGDIDGSTFTGHLRLPNDPCADGWADFLLPKFFLLLIGTLSSGLAAFTRPSAQNLFPSKAQSKS